MRPLAIGFLIAGCGARTELDWGLPTDGGSLDTSTVGDAGVDAPSADQDASIRNVAVGISEDTILYLRDGEVFSWGWNAFGEIGDGTINDRHVPTHLSALHLVVELSASHDTACVRLISGVVECWGLNLSGLLTTDGGGGDLREPSPIGVMDATSLSHGSGNTFCAARNDGSHICWGNREPGLIPGVPQIGLGTPIVTPAFDHATSVATDDSFTCAIFSGTVQCSGFDHNGELGDGRTPDQDPKNPFKNSRAYLLPVIGVDSVAAVSLDTNAGYALRSDGTVRWWGAMYRPGATPGDLVVVEEHLTAVDLGLSGVIQIAAAGGHVCALLSDHTVTCRGLNLFGQLGDGTRDSTSSFHPVPGLKNVTQIAAGFFNTCAITNDTELYCWGSNAFGQMGNGVAGSPQLTPAKVNGL